MIYAYLNILAQSQILLISLYVNSDYEFLVQMPSFLSIILSSLVQVTYSIFLKNAY